MIRHRCMEPAHCPDCPIHHRGFCDAFGLLLRKFAGHLAARYGAVIPEDRQEQILGDVVAAVVEGVHRFQGRRGARFSTWAWHIGHNKICDHFRRRHAKAETVPEYVAGRLFDSHDPRSDIELKLALTGCFKTHLADDPKGCLRLLLELYRTFHEGRDQKDLARAYGLKPNTFNQRLRRCRELVRHLFEECVEDAWHGPASEGEK